MKWDTVIIGGGPAGLSASLYAARAKLKTLVIEKETVGGLINETDYVENVPGSLREVSGVELTARMKEQAEAFGAEFVFDEITEVNLEGETKILKGNETYEASTVIIATGAKPRRLGVKGENEHIGKGVSFCVNCDANFYEGMEVFVIGGGDSALVEAVSLTKYARKVTVVHRRDELRAAKFEQERAMKNPKISFRLNSVVKEIKGDPLVTSIVFEDTVTGETEEVFADKDDGMMGIFVYVGSTPDTNVFKDMIDMEKGYIITDEEMRTNIPGVFAAGDCRKKFLRQVVTANADGAIAAVSCDNYLSSL